MDTRFVLGQDAIPTAWYNALPDLPAPLQPPLHPATNEPVGPDDLAPLFPMGLIAQEVSLLHDVAGLEAAWKASLTPPKAPEEKK